MPTNNFVETNCFTTFQNKNQLVKHLTVDVFKMNVAKTDGFSQHCFWKCCKTNGFSNYIFGNAVKPIV